MCFICGLLGHDKAHCPRKFQPSFSNLRFRPELRARRVICRRMRFSFVVSPSSFQKATGILLVLFLITLKFMQRRKSFPPILSMTQLLFMSLSFNSNNLQPNKSYT
ncbi:hypothetical protein LINGRAHAP2_LOCUS8100 [Linum grandiflorum]